MIEKRPDRNYYFDIAGYEIAKSPIGCSAAARLTCFFGGFVL